MAAKKKIRRGIRAGQRGAPPKEASLVAEGLALVAGGASPEDAAEQLTKAGRPISSRTLRRAGATARGGVSTKPPSSPPDPPSPPAGSQVAASAPALPQGGAVSGRPDLLELLRRIGKARNAAAWAEVEEGLRVHVAGGEGALAPWLARPVTAVEVGVDELAALGRGLDLAVEVMSRAEPGGAALRALREVASLGKSVASVKARRPHVDGPDEVTRRLVAVRDQAVERIGVITSEEAADFALARADLEAWLGTLGAIGGEAVRRLGVVLDGAVPAEAA